MKKVLIYILAFTMLLGVCGCGNHSNTKKEKSKKEEHKKSEKNNSEKDKDEKDKPDKNGEAVYKTPNDLIFAYIDCLNGDISVDEFIKNGFDENGYNAYWMVEDCPAIDDFDEAYEVVCSIEKGAEYINSNCKHFAEKWEMEYGHSITEGEVADLRNEYGGQLNKSDISEAFNDLSAFAPYDRTVIENNKWEGDYGIRKYKIYVDDPDQVIQSVNIEYVYVNGGYYWVMVHQTA